MRLQPSVGNRSAFALREPIKRLSVDTYEADGTSGQLYRAEGFRRTEEAEAEQHTLRPIGRHPLRTVEPAEAGGEYVLVMADEVLGSELLGFPALSLGVYREGTVCHLKPSSS